MEAAVRKISAKQKCDERRSTQRASLTFAFLQMLMCFNAFFGEANLQVFFAHRFTSSEEERIRREDVRRNKQSKEIVY
jgi:hypothetical protein